MLKVLLVALLLFCFQISDIMTVDANEPDPEDPEQQISWKKDKPDKKEEKAKNPESARQQPVDMNTLQQRYPDTFFLQGPTDQRRIALTFDDGPDPRFTEDVLDVLNQYNVPSTFF